MVVVKVCLCLFIIGTVYCEEVNPEYDDPSTELSEPLRKQIEIEQWLEDKRDRMVELIKGKCEKYGKSYQFTEADDPIEEIVTCYSYVFEEEVAGVEELPDVMKRSCAKKPQFRECAHDVAARLSPCLSADERPYLDNALNVLYRLNEFLCFGNGAMLAQFVVEAETCVAQQRSALHQCSLDMGEALMRLDANTTDVLIDDNVFEVAFVKGLCVQLVEFQNCLVDAFRHCEGPAPVYFTNWTFGIILDGLPCKEQGSRAGARV